MPPQRLPRRTPLLLPTTQGLLLDHSFPSTRTLAIRETPKFPLCLLSRHCLSSTIGACNVQSAVYLYYLYITVPDCDASPRNQDFLAGTGQITCRVRPLQPGHSGCLWLPIITALWSSTVQLRIGGGPSRRHTPRVFQPHAKSSPAHCPVLTPRCTKKPPLVGFVASILSGTGSGEYCVAGEHSIRVEAPLARHLLAGPPRPHYAKGDSSAVAGMRLADRDNLDNSPSLAHPKNRIARWPSCHLYTPLLAALFISPHIQPLAEVR